jgi:hypothetical protein
MIAPARSSFEGRLVEFSNKKGDPLSLTVEGAIFKGGAALKAVRSAAAEIALNKAVTGRYRAASELIASAVPASFLKTFQTIAGDPAKNKLAFTLFCQSVLRQVPKAGKDFTEKQQEARGVARAFIDELIRVATEKGDSIEHLTGDVAGEVIENGASA